LSIKPEYAERILSGEKRFEFRKRLYRNSRVKTVVIYATQPVGKVVGEFSVSATHSDEPSALWDRTRHAAGITKEFFAEYFDGRDVGHAIEVREAKRYARPKSIDKYLASGVPPQSYAYLA